MAVSSWNFTSTLAAKYECLETARVHDVMPESSLSNTVCGNRSLEEKKSLFLRCFWGSCNSTHDEEQRRVLFGFCCLGRLFPAPYLECQKFRARLIFHGKRTEGGSPEWECVWGGVRSYAMTRLLPWWWWEQGKYLALPCEETPLPACKPPQKGQRKNRSC